eukprot:1160874-Pelagomonas_calceolata.AAC.13
MHSILYALALGSCRRRRKPLQVPSKSAYLALGSCRRKRKPLQVPSKPAKPSTKPKEISTGLFTNRSGPPSFALGSCRMKHKPALLLLQAP